VERIRRLEMDTTEEALGVVTALGELASKNRKSDPRIAQTAHTLQTNLLKQLLKTDVDGPIIFELDDDSRIPIRGSLISGGDETDLQSLTLLDAVQKTTPSFEAEIVQAYK
jgi:hypothetical protein